MGKILAAHGIVEAIKSGDLKIAYYSIKDKNNEIIHMKRWRFVNLYPEKDIDAIDADIREYFYSNLEPDSFRCTLGPYCLIEERIGNKGKEFVFKQSGELAINIKKANHLLLYSKQFVLIGSNEYIEVSAKLGGTVFPNVRNTDVGLSPVTGCLDPAWKGVLQLGIVNLTDYTKQLHYLDAICLIRFHLHSTATNTDLIERFRKKRPHYGNNWWDIEDEKGRTLFPRRKEYSVDGEFKKYLDKERNTKEVANFLKKLGASIGLIGGIGLITYIVKLSYQMNTAIDNSLKIVRIEQRLESIKEINFINTFSLDIPKSLEGSMKEYYFQFNKTSDIKPFISLSSSELEKFRYTVKFKKFDNNFVGVSIQIFLLTDTDNKITVDLLTFLHGS